jgi:hypothetical protein
MWPTLLSPWFVVFYYISDQEWFYRGADEKFKYTTDPKEAFIFSHLHPAARIADSEKKHVRVIYSREEATQFMTEDINENHWSTSSSQTHRNS